MMYFSKEELESILRAIDRMNNQGFGGDIEDDIKLKIIKKLEDME